MFDEINATTGIQAIDMILAYNPKEDDDETGETDINYKILGDVLDYLKAVTKKYNIDKNYTLYEIREKLTEIINNEKLNIRED